LTWAGVHKSRCGQGKTIDKDLRARASANVTSRHVLKKIRGPRLDVMIWTGLGLRTPRHERDMIDVAQKD